AVTVNVCVSPPPAPIPERFTVCSPAFSRIAGGSGIAFSVGGSLTGVTFTVTVTPVNDPPTLNAIPDPPAILENAGLQTVNLSGIGAGGGETQTLTVTATSNNTAVI